MLHDRVALAVMGTQWSCKLVCCFAVSLVLWQLCCVVLYDCRKLHLPASSDFVGC